MKRQIFVILGILLGILSLAVTAKAEVFKVVDDVVQQDTPSDYGDDFVFGSRSLNYYSGEENRFLFDKSNGAFRTGYCDDTSWNTRGYYSFGEGYNTKAQGLASHAEGVITRTLGYSSHAEGSGSNTTGTSDCGHAEGCNSKSYLTSQHSHASGLFISSGDAQYSQLIAKIETSTNADSELYLDESGLRPVLPYSTTWAFQIFVTARQTAGSGIIGDSAGYKIEGVIKRDDSDNTRLVGSVTKTVLAEDQPAWDVKVSADDGTAALKILVNGETGKTIRWVATIHLTEVGG